MWDFIAHHHNASYTVADNAIYSDSHDDSDTV